MLPGTLLYVVGTDAVISGLRQGRIPWALIGVFAAVVILVGVLVRIARKKLQDKQNKVHPVDAYFHENG